MSFPIYSPQGDGNEGGVVACNYDIYCVISYLFPARGRKPIVGYQHWGYLCPLSFPIYSPQGDGNYVLSRTYIIFLAPTVISYLFPARGRKLGFKVRRRFDLSFCHGHFLSIPRKGTETGVRSGRLENYPVISYLFPARGRKRNFSSSGSSLKRHFLSIPRKGTETRIVLLHDSSFKARSFPIYSPQRDGNHLLSIAERQIPNVISYLFPARGRKQRCPVSVSNRNRGHFLSIPRKGTETYQVPIGLLGIFGFSRSFPIYSPQGDGNRCYFDG